MRIISNARFSACKVTGIESSYRGKMAVHHVRSYLLLMSVVFTVILLNVIFFTSDEDAPLRRGHEQEESSRIQHRILAGHHMHESDTQGEEYMFIKKTVFDQIPIDASTEATRRPVAFSQSVENNEVKQKNAANNLAEEDIREKTKNISSNQDSRTVCQRKKALRRMENLFGDRFDPYIDPFLTLSALHNPNSTFYPLPFGFKQIADVTEALLRKLPETGLPEEIEKIPCRRCMVVGSGGILRGSLMGKHINSYDVVFRLNVAPVIGYEADVGSKTTVRLAYPESSFLHPDNYTLGWTLLVIPFKMADITWTDYVVEGRSMNNLKGFWKGIPQFVPKPRQEIRLFNPEILRETSSQLIGLKLGNGEMKANVPTSGTLAIMVALRICDEVAVSGFGYDTSRPQAPIHYYDDNKEMKSISQSWTHNISPERQMLHSLVRQGVIRDVTKGLQ